MLWWGIFTKKIENFHQHLAFLLRPYRRLNADFLRRDSAWREKAAGIAADMEVGGYTLAEEKSLVNQPPSNKSDINESFLISF